MVVTEAVPVVRQSLENGRCCYSRLLLVFVCQSECPAEEADKTELQPEAKAKEETDPPSDAAAVRPRSEAKDGESASTDKAKAPKVARTELPLNQKTVERPADAYDIMCYTQQLSDMSVAVYFHNSTRKTNAPYLPPFRSVFQDGLRDKLYVSAIGIRCTQDGKPMRSREAQSEEQAEWFGWPVFITDMVTDANMYAFHLCNTLNGTKEYIEAFDSARRFGRKPFFIVTKNTTANPLHKWDQVMVRNDVLKYVCNKFNLRDMQVRMQYLAEGRWENLLKHYFADVDAAKEAVESYIGGEEDVEFSP